MKTEPEYLKDLTEIRSMMEQSTKFLSLTGLSGILAGIYALAGAFAAYKLYYRNDNDELYNTVDYTLLAGNYVNLLLIAAAVLFLAVSTALLLSYRKSIQNGESLWNPAARRVAIHMAIPLMTGAIFMYILYLRSLIGLLAPLTLIFYGMALINASKFTYGEMKLLGVLQILLGLLATYFIGHGLLFWAVGFGLLHIIFGVYLHLTYEK